MSRYSQTSTIDDELVRFVRLANRVHCLHYRIPVPNWPTFAAIMDAMGDGYNDFDPRHVTVTFAPLFPTCNGIEFGAEGTAVLYLTIPYFEHQRRDHPAHPAGREYTDEQRRAHTQQLIDWAHEVQASEVTVQQFVPGQADQPQDVWNSPGDAPCRVRVWWD